LRRQCSQLFGQALRQHGLLCQLHFNDTRSLFRILERLQPLYKLPAIGLLVMQGLPNVRQVRYQTHALLVQACYLFLPNYQGLVQLPQLCLQLLHLLLMTTLVLLTLLLD
jgi:hypothetical protein